VLGRVESSNMTALDLGTTLSETVTYRLAK